MAAIQWVGFFVFSAALLYISKLSLRERLPHGYYRFFAWEAALALVLINLDSWFDNPFSPRQMISWLLLISSIHMVVQGYRLLRRDGKTAGSFENTTILVKAGVYQYVRHPMYSSLLLLSLGALLKNPTPLSGALTVAAFLFLTLTAKAEEQENLEKFGEEYAEYMKSTKRFIPHLF